MTRKKRRESELKKTRALKQNNLQSLCGLRECEIEKMTNLISIKKISIKSTKSKSRQAALQGFCELCQEKRKFHLIKNELMFVYKKFPLPSKATNYKP